MRPETAREKNIPESEDYKIVPRTERSTSEKIKNLRTFLAANIAVATHDADRSRAARFQEHLDTLELLVNHSRDRL